MINATIPPWYDGEGLLGVDYACAFLVAMAALAQFWRCAEPASTRYVLTWQLIVGFGWTVWAVRLWTALLLGYDPQVPLSSGLIKCVEWWRKSRGEKK